MMKNKQKWYSMFLVSSILATTITTPVYAVSEVGESSEESVSSVTNVVPSVNKELEKSLIPENSIENKEKIVSEPPTTDITAEEVHNEGGNVEVVSPNEQKSIDSSANIEATDTDQKKATVPQEKIKEQSNLLNEDENGPTIDISSLEISQPEATMGETVKVSINAEDENGVDNLVVSYQKALSGIYESFNLEFNEETGKYETDIEIDKYMESGLWQLDSIEAYDNLNNYTYIYNTQTTDNGDIDLSKGNFTVIGGKEDITGPTIDLSTLEINKTEAIVGETVTISLKAEDENEVNQVNVTYLSPLSGNYENFYLELNKKTGKFETNIEIDKYMETGLWQLDSIEAYDNLNNSTYIYSKQSANDGEADLSKGNFTVIGGKEDITGPSVDLSSLEINRNEAAIDDTVTISLKAEDENEVNEVSVTYLMPLSGNYESFYLELNKKTGKFETNIEIDKYMESGLWQLDSIEAYDSLNNSTHIYSKQSTNDGDADLSNGNFTVNGGKEDISGPIIDLTSLKISKNKATIGDTITIRINAEDENNVDGVSISYLNPLSGNYSDFSLEFNEKTGNYETEINVDKYTESGLWRLDSINAYDGLNNQSSLISNLNDYGDTDLSMGNFEIMGGKEDIAGPTIDVSSLKINKKEVKVGENIIISINAKDENEVDQVYVSYVNQLSGAQKLFVMEYNAKTGMFEAEIDNDKYTESGLWQIDNIEAYDNLENSTLIYNTQINDYGDEDLSAGNFTLSGGKEDFIGPVIDVASLKISKKEARVGETVKISMKLEDKSEISEVRVSYMSPITGNLEGFNLELNKKTGEFETEIVIDKYMESGFWKITSIIAYDSFYNETHIYNNQIDDYGDEDLSAGNFNLIGGKEDFSGPIIDATSLKVSQKETKVGDIINISIKAEDKNNVEEMSITYLSPITKNYESSSMKFNKESGFFELEIEINKYIESGVWKIDSIEAIDGLYNSSWINNTQLYEDGVKDLSAGEFTVIGGKVDVSSPTINEKSLTVNTKKATIGEEIKISVKAEDENGVEGVYVNYQKPISSQMYRLKLNLNKSTGFYEGVIKIDKTIESGKWKVISIQAYDTYNNVNNLYNNNYDEYYNGADLNTGEFTVYGASEIEVPPTYEVSDISVSLKEAVIGDKIKISIQLPTDVMITFATVYYKTPDSDESVAIELKYNKNTKGYEGYYEVTKESKLGLWKMEAILYSDILNNYVEVLSKDIDQKDGMDLSSGNFKIFDEILLQSISINKNSITLEKNSSENLNVEYTPSNTSVDKKITWTSSDTKVATVDETGKVKALSAGTATITAKVGSKTAKTTVKVSEKAPSVSYSTHVQSYGWMSPVKDGKLSGTEGEKKRMEAIKVSIENNDDLDVTYSTHVQSNGWMNWVSDGNLSGTSGEAKRLEAIKLKLTGKDADKYDIYYRVHAETNGWLGWAKNGEEAGTEGFGRRLEAIEIVVVEKGATSPGSTTGAFVKKEIIPTVSYTTHVQSIGWQSWVKDGIMAGTSGKAKRLEGIKVKLENLPYAGGVQYKTHVQSYGWQGWSTNGALSGTSGKAKRLEAIQIQLTGEIAKKYDIYYRVHAESYGWLGWAKNGESSGTESKAKRLEGIEIKLVKKGEKAPSSLVKSFIK